MADKPLVKPGLSKHKPCPFFRVPRCNLRTLKILAFLSVCVCVCFYLCFLMVFQQAALNAVTPHICACEAYASPVFYKPVQFFASLLANGTNKLISLGSQPNLKFNFNCAQPNLNFNFNWVKA